MLSLSNSFSIFWNVVLILALALYFSTKSVTINSYLDRALKEINKEELNVDIEKEIDDYIDFVYDPNGNFLDGIFVFNKLDITETVSNKYKLLGLNISTEKVSKDGIDSLLNDVSLIYLIQNIENNILSMENIKFICDYNKIKPLDTEII